MNLAGQLRTLYQTRVISPNGGSFTEAQTVSITCATEGAKIYYTTDGSAPTTSSKLYEGAFTLRATTVVKAIAIKDGMVDSEVVSATFSKKSSGGGGGGGGYRPTIPSTPTTDTEIENKPSIAIGDVNKDGVLDAFDAAMILKFIVGLEPIIDAQLADFNGDGKVNALDSSAILKRINNISQII